MQDRREATEQGDIYVYIARYGSFKTDSPEGQLAFTSEEKAKNWVESTHTVLKDGAEWKEQGPRMERAEDKIGNWAQIEKIRVSDPEGFLAYE